MEMVLNINGDLSQRIMDTANTREHIRELAEKLTPPRYAWPKELPYDSILNAISDAATDRCGYGGTLYLFSYPTFTLS